MNSHLTVKRLRSLGVFLFYFLLSTSAFPQGSLTPPGPPGSTMKSLDQVEARTIVNAANTPGDASHQFIITAPGSYYLTGNITGVSGKNGISINADNVTLDLNGFALIGVSGSLNGITVPAAHGNLRIRNGSAQSWGGSGVNCLNASNSQFDHLRVSQNSSPGFRCRDGNVLSEISAEANNGTGITTGNRCTLTACNAANNTNGGGIEIGESSTIIACTAVSNLDSGIYAGSNNCTVKDCTAALNGFGIYGVAARLSIIGCTASQNTDYGIWFGSDSLIMGNNASDNGIDGFHSSGGSLNRIDGNTACHNAQYGFLLGADLVVRNSAFANTTANYSPTTSINYGPINSASTSTSPWANFQ